MHETEQAGPILAIGAHPDDTEFSAGGSIALFTAAGRRVSYVVCTDGSKGSKDRSIAQTDLIARRKVEQRSAARVLGVTDILFLDQVDGELENNRQVRLRIAKRIRELRPSVILTHDAWKPWMLHPDHRACGLAVTDSFVAARDHLYLPELESQGLEPWEVPELWLWSTETPDHVVDITDTMDTKLSAIKSHISQVDDPVYIDKRMRDAAHDMGSAAGFSFAEGFKRLIPHH